MASIIIFTLVIAFLITGLVLAWKVFSAIDTQIKIIEDDLIEMGKGNMNHDPSCD